MQMTLGYWLRKERYSRAYLIERLKLEEVTIAIFGGSTSATFGALLSMVLKLGNFGE